MLNSRLEDGESFSEDSKDFYEIPRYFSLEECTEDQAFQLAFPALKTFKENNTLSANKQKRTTIVTTCCVRYSFSFLRHIPFPFPVIFPLSIYSLISIRQAPIPDPSTCPYLTASFSFVLLYLFLLVLSHCPFGYRMDTVLFLVRVGCI